MRANFIIVFAVLLCLTAPAFAAGADSPDVNIASIDPNPEVVGMAWTPAADGNAFSYYRDGNLMIDFNVADIDLNMEDFNAGTQTPINVYLYYSSDQNAFSNVIVADLNLWELNDPADPASGSKWCDDFNFNSMNRAGDVAGAATIVAAGGDPDDVNTGVTCHYDWNISQSLVVGGDGNFYLDINVYDAVDSNATDTSDANFIIDNTAPTMNGASPDFNSFDINKTGDYNGTNMFYPAGGGGTNYPSTDSFIGRDQNLTLRIQEVMSKSAGESHIQAVDFNFWDINSIRFGDINSGAAIRTAAGVTWTMVPDINVQDFNYDTGGGEPVWQKYPRAVIRDWAGNETDQNLQGMPLLMMGMTRPPEADGNSTNFQDLNDFERVKLFTVSKAGYGRIRFSSDVNMADYTLVTKLKDLNEHFSVTRITTTRNFNDLNIWFDSVYFNDLNLACGITLYNLPYTSRPGIKTGGDQNCGNICSSISMSGNQLDFNVAHFSDYYTDANAPVITNTTTAAQSSPITLAVTTDEVATCKYASTEIQYSAMTQSMSGSGTTSHTATINESSSGAITYYVACEDVTANASSGTSIPINLTSGGTSQVCGNKVCDTGETASTCPTDCPAVCGDGACTHTEGPTSCPEDCVSGCGDGACSGSETCSNCPGDCGTCPETGTDEEIINQTTSSAQPTESDVQDTLSELGFTSEQISDAQAASEMLSVERGITVSSSEEAGQTTFSSAIDVSLTNTTDSELKNVRVVETIPKEVAQSADEISSNVPFAVLKDDPVIQFTFSSVAPGQTVTATYTISKKLEASQTESYLTPPIPSYAIPAEEAACDKIDCDDSNPCTSDVCANGECAYSLKEDGTSCGFSKECKAGVCVSIGKDETPVSGAAGLSLELIVIAVAIAAVAGYVFMRYSKK